MKNLLNECEKARHKIVLPHGFTIFALDTYARNELSDVDYSNNVYCIDNSGLIIWRVHAPSSSLGRDSFTSVVRDGDRIVAIRESGARFLVDAETGSLSPFGFMR